jgi:asparagine synthase (glutamine-hydrolysing)
MCGISGLFNADGPLPPGARAIVEAMNGAIAHRGPDGDGFFEHEQAVLGHRRLAIIDIARGHQPMANEDESCWIVFNGEIYNHHDLRPILEAKGHRFRTSCDTEVILHGYEEFGAAIVDRLEGMFAFAIFDGRRRELFAARDRLGKKPFFYTTAAGVFHFGSELPALTQSPLWSPEIDAAALEGYFSLGYVLAPATIYRGVQKLEPGHWLRVSKAGVETRSYWDVTEFNTDDRSDDALVADIDAALRAAVQARLESEVPLGAFLSGGIDSGLVVSYMAEALGDRLVTTSVGFGTAQHSELAAAALVAEHFHSHHYPTTIEPNLDQMLTTIVSRLGEPLADSSAIPTWYVSKAAREHVTVALSGDGGDESFAGYDFRYVPHAMEGAARRLLPGPLSRWAGGVGARWPRSPKLPKALRAGTLLENLAGDPASAYYADLTFLKPRNTRRLLGLGDGTGLDGNPIYEAITAAYRRGPAGDPVQQAEYADLKIYLPNDPLVKVDRMSMAHGLEVRCPLLDRRVVELAFRIPSARKQTWRESKRLLRLLARRRLPAGLWQLPKRGFHAPVGAWIAGPHAAVFRDEVLGGGSAIGAVVDVNDLTRRFDEHRDGTRDEGYALWAAWVLERWLRAARR